MPAIMIRQPRSSFEGHWPLSLDSSALMVCTGVTPSLIQFSHSPFEPQFGPGAVECRKAGLSFSETRGMKATAVNCSTLGMDSPTATPPTLGISFSCRGLKERPMQVLSSPPAKSGPTILESKDPRSPKIQDGLTWDFNYPLLKHRLPWMATSRFITPYRKARASPRKN